MKIAVVSDTRRPTLPDGGHGLGMSAHSIAAGLVSRGYHVTMHAGPGSEFEDGPLTVHENEMDMARTLLKEVGQYDAILDTSHYHHLSRRYPDGPVLNRICDLECQWTPPNTVVNSPFMQRKYGGRLVNTGIHWAGIPFYPEHDGTLAFMAIKHPKKGWPRVKGVAKSAGRELRVIEGLTGRQKWDALGRAYALLHPTRGYAADRAPLEAAACGVPTLCLSGDGSEYHVKDGATGFVCSDEAEMARLIAACEVSVLDRSDAREWVADTHGLSQMIDDYSVMLAALAGGQRW